MTEPDYDRFRELAQRWRDAAMFEHGETTPIAKMLEQCANELDAVVLAANKGETQFTPDMRSEIVLEIVREAEHALDEARRTISVGHPVNDHITRTLERIQELRAHLASHKRAALPGGQE